MNKFTLKILNLDYLGPNYRKNICNQKQKLKSNKIS